MIPADLLEPSTPALVAERVEAEHGRLDLVVNSAGVGGRGSFASGGWAEVERLMAINFDAQVPHRGPAAAAAPLGPERDRVRGQRGRAGGPGPERALLGQQVRPGRLDRGALHGGARATASMSPSSSPGSWPPRAPRELLARPWTRWMVSTEDKVAEAIVEAWQRRQAERYVPRPYGLVPVARTLLPGLYRWVVGGGAFTATPKDTTRATPEGG